MAIDDKLDFFFFFQVFVLLPNSMFGFLHLPFPDYVGPWILNFVSIISWQDIYNSKITIMVLYPYVSCLGIQLQLWMTKTTTA